jgi:hypothetical protein
MTTPRKLDPARAWMFAEKLLAEDDDGESAEEVETLSVAQIEEEMRAGGYDPARMPTTEQFLARGRARAAERAKAMEKEPPARAVPIAPRNPAHWPLLLVAAVFALFIIVLAATKRDAIATFFRHEHQEPIGPDNEFWRPTPPPTPREQAEALRDLAVNACEEEFWALCRSQLDDAKTLDPGGESAERVQTARSAIEEGLHPEGGGKKNKKDKK